MNSYEFAITIFISLLSDSIWASLEKDKSNSFIHEDDKLNIHRMVTFSGYSRPENLIKLSRHSIQNGYKSIPKEEDIEIEIKHTKVIRFFNATINQYNGNVGYIINSSDGRWFIKFRLYCPRNIITLPKGATSFPFLPSSSDTFPTLELKIPESARGSDTDLNNYLKNIPLRQEPRFFWATVEVFPDNIMWNPENGRLKFSNLETQYEVIEGSDFQ